MPGDDAGMEMETVTESAPLRGPGCQVRQRVVMADGCASVRVSSHPPLGAASANGPMMEGEEVTSVTQTLQTMTKVGRGQKLKKNQGQRRRERASRLHGET